MPLRATHEIHARRLSRNVGVGLLLAALMVLMFGLTIAKVQGGGSVQAYDHTYRPLLLPADN